MKTGLSASDGMGMARGTRMLLCAFFTLVLIGGALPLQAADADALARQARTELRGAQNAMFNGKLDDAEERLAKALETIGAIQAANAEHRDLGKLQGDAAKLRTDIERRTKRPFTPAVTKAPAAAPSKPAQSGAAAASASAQKPPAPAAPPERLPYNARKPMADFNRMLDSIEGAYGRLEKFLAEGAEPERVEQTLNGLAKALDELEPTLAAVREIAAKQDAGDHPDFAVASREITEFKDKYPDAAKAAAEYVTGVRAGREAVQKDCDALVAAFLKARDEYFNSASGYPKSFHEAAPAREFLEQIRAFESRERDQLLRHMEAFAAKYGASESAIDQQVQALGYAGNWRAGAAYAGIAEGIANVARTRVVVCEELVERAGESLSRLPKMHDFFREQGHAAIRELVEVAALYDPENARMSEFRAGLAGLLADDAAAFARKIDAREWKATRKGSEKEAKAAEHYLKGSEDWARRAKDPYTVLGVSITGDWSVQETDLLGRPIMYGVPAVFAVQLDADKPLDRARVFNVTFRTAEGANIKQEPPFHSITVGDSWLIRPAALAKARR
jgi:hypothetical protein